MTADRFYTLIEESLGGGCMPGELAVDEARRTAHVVLQVLATCLSHRERLHLALYLPRMIAVDLVAAPETSIGDPLTRVADELQLDEEIAARRMACVIRVLRELAGPLPTSLIDAAGVSDLS